MDEFVVQFLHSSGIPEFVDIFRDHKIDEQTLFTLDVSDINELIPIIGQRRKFLNHFNKVQIERAVIQSADIQIVNSSVNSDETHSETSSTSHQSTIPSDVDESLFLNSNLIEAHQYSQKATIGLPYILEPAGPSSQSTVKKLLDTTDEGQLIKASYGPNKTFLRNKLCEIIVKHELKESKDKKITTHRFIELASEIYDIFPHENPEIYYVPYSKDLNSKPKAARGKLWNAYIYLRGKYRELGLLPKKQSEGANATSTRVYDDTEVEDKLQWLKNNSQPLDTVKNYWTLTFEARNKLTSSIDKYFNTFPILKEPTGYTLLEADFLQSYPDKQNIFYTTWSQYSKIVFQLCKKRHDTFMKSLIDDYEKTFSKINVDDFTDTDSLFTLTLLPLFFPSVNLKCKKSNKWKPSRIEIRQGFILHVKDSANLQNEIQLRRNKYHTYGFTEQPVPIIVGSYDAIEACYVHINNTFYKVETPFKAVDIAFKVYHALNAEYPAEAAVVWTYVEKGIYNIETKFTQKFVSVSSFISDVQQRLNAVRS